MASLRDRVRASSEAVSARSLSRTTASLSVTVLLAGLAAGGCGGEPAPQAGSAQPESRAAATASAHSAEKVSIPRGEGDPQATERPRGNAPLAELGEVQRPEASGVKPRLTLSQGRTLADYMAAVSNDVATFWQGDFNEAGYQFEPATQIIIRDGETTRSACDPLTSFESDYKNAFYCSVNETIVLPLGFFRNQLMPEGDTAVAFVVAHEYAHRVQDLLGTFDERESGKVRSKDIELQADCFGGVWAASVFRRGLLEEGDVEEAVKITSSVGDPPGTPANDPGAHGSSEERVASFRKGYDDGSADACPIKRRKRDRGSSDSA